MSNENDDNKRSGSRVNSASSSRSKTKNDFTDVDGNSPTVELTKSRLSSASKKNEEQRSAVTDNSSHHTPRANESPNGTPQTSMEINNNDQHKTERQSPVTSRHDINQSNKNQSTFNSHDNQFNNEEQSSLSPLQVNEFSNDGPTTKSQHITSSRDNNNFNSDSNDRNEEDTLRSSRNTTPSNNQRKLPEQNSEDQELDDVKNHQPQTEDTDVEHPSCQFKADKKWLDCQYNQNESIKKPDELASEMEDPPGEIDKKILDRIQGSIIGMALGDALGAHVEFRPHQYMKEHPVTTLEGGGTWGLQKGQFTDDTSMALCLANSLIARKDFIPYDQLVRYKWWHRSGYMSSTGACFDIGAATSQSLSEFERRQKKFAEKHGIHPNQMDKLSDFNLLGEFEVYCSEEGVAGNGALMRLAPIPLFFHRNKYAAIEFSGLSGQITHGDKKAYDACRFYGALIVALFRGHKKKAILSNNFYSAHKHWFRDEPLHPEILLIAEGSYKKKGGYAEGIAGKGYIVKALEAALWAFWSDGGNFKTGALAAVNLGDDTDTTAAIYGQLAGACYGYKNLPEDWLEHVYAHDFMKTLSKWIVYEGEQWDNNRQNSFDETGKGTH